MKKEDERFSLEAFQEEGYLREVNRQFFHRLGLSLVLIKNERGGDIEWGYIGKWKKGISFNLDKLDREKIQKWEIDSKRIRGEMRPLEKFPSEIKLEEWENKEQIKQQKEQLIEDYKIKITTEISSWSIWKKISIAFSLLLSPKKFTKNLLKKY